MKIKRILIALGIATASLAAGQAGAYVLGPTSPGKWGPAAVGTGATITYSFMGTGVDCSGSGEVAGCSITALGDFGPAFAVWEAEIELAMAAWAAVADLTFVKVADLGEAFNAATQLSGDMRFGGHFFNGPGGVLAHGYYPPDNGESAAGDMHFDTGDCWEAAFDGSGDSCYSIFQVAAHELGHALGLDHTLVSNSLMNAFYTEAFSGPQADDIAGMVYLYGTPVAVPEPGTTALFGAAFLAAAVGALSRRRTTKTN